MYRKTLITTILCIILCIQFGQGLQCYEHELCLLNACDTIEMRKVTCQSSDSRCWKVQTPAGIKRGCGTSNCKVAISINVFETANVCCSKDLCNASNRITFSIITMSIIGILHRFYIQ